MLETPLHWRKILPAAEEKPKSFWDAVDDAVLLVTGSTPRGGASQSAGNSIFIRPNIVHSLIWLLLNLVPINLFFNRNCAGFNFHFLQHLWINEEEERAANVQSVVQLQSWATYLASTNNSIICHRKVPRRILVSPWQQEETSFGGISGGEVFNKGLEPWTETRPRYNCQISILFYFLFNSLPPSFAFEFLNVCD